MSDSFNFWRKNVRPGTQMGEHMLPYTLRQRIYDRLVLLFARFNCWVFGHEYRVHQKFSPWSRRVVCDCCDGDWAMNDNVRIMTPWTSDFASFYEERGHTIHPVRKP